MLREQSIVARGRKKSVPEEATEELDVESGMAAGASRGGRVGADVGAVKVDGAGAE